MVREVNYGGSGCEECGVSAGSLMLAKASPRRFLQGDTPKLIDEWQVVPSIWDAVRFEVDQRDEFGQFILTGSVTPPATDEIAHSGTGRITRMRMRPMTLFESGESSGEVSLAARFRWRIWLLLCAEVDGPRR